MSGLCMDHSSKKHFYIWCRYGFSICKQKIETANLVSKIDVCYIKITLISSVYKHVDTPTFENHRRLYTTCTKSLSDYFMHTVSYKIVHTWTLIPNCFNVTGTKIWKHTKWKPLLTHITAKVLTLRNRDRNICHVIVN